MSFIFEKAIVSIKNHAAVFQSVEQESFSMELVWSQSMDNHWYTALVFPGQNIATQAYANIQIHKRVCMFCCYYNYNQDLP